MRRRAQAKHQPPTTSTSVSHRAASAAVEAPSRPTHPQCFSSGTSENTAPPCRPRPERNPGVGGRSWARRSGRSWASESVSLDGLFLADHLHLDAEVIRRPVALDEGAEAVEDATRVKLCEMFEVIVDGPEVVHLLPKLGEKFGSEFCFVDCDSNCLCDHNVFRDHR